MASPVGHLIVGVGAALGVTEAVGGSDAPAVWAGAAIAACLPDLDILPSLWGVPYQRVHRQASHSILIMGPLAALAWVAVLALDLAVDWRLVAAWTAALMSHLILDVLCTGPVLGKQGLGVPLFWPLTPRRWFVPRPMFPEVNLLEGVSPRIIGRAFLLELLHLSPAALALILLGRLL
jgi:membrane-bound metal-dependent hydrolase YbcI (DUF457 family)